jgi:hypothetical protein
MNTLYEALNIIVAFYIIIGFAVFVQYICGLIVDFEENPPNIKQIIFMIIICGPIPTGISIIVLIMYIFIKPLIKIYEKLS